MSDDEAINTLQLNRPFAYSELRKAIDIAIQAIKENQKYHEIGTIEKCLSAMKKQTPKKVYHFIDDDTFETSCCGLNVSNQDYNYCPNCGSLLGEVEEIKE